MCSLFPARTNTPHVRLGTHPPAECLVLHRRLTPHVTPPPPARPGEARAARTGSTHTSAARPAGPAHVRPSLPRSTCNVCTQMMGRARCVDSSGFVVMAAGPADWELEAKSEVEHKSAEALHGYLRGQ